MVFDEFWDFKFAFINSIFSQGLKSQIKNNGEKKFVLVLFDLLSKVEAKCSNDSVRFSVFAPHPCV